MIGRKWTLSKGSNIDSMRAAEGTIYFPLNDKTIMCRYKHLVYPNTRLFKWDDLDE